MGNDKRKGHIEFWWDYAVGPGFAVDARTHDRLYGAFTKVLLSMSDPEFEQFVSMSVNIICDVNRGHAYRFWIPVIPGRKLKIDHFDLNIIYLSPRVSQWTDDHLNDTIAHEAAHLILGHQTKNYESQEEGLKDEAEADALAVRWGFRKSYSKNIKAKFLLLRGDVKGGTHA